MVEHNAQYPHPRHWGLGMGYWVRDYADSWHLGLFPHPPVPVMCVKHWGCQGLSGVACAVCGVRLSVTRTGAVAAGGGS